MVDIKGKTYTVTAIKETLSKTNLGLLRAGDKVNLERSMLMNGRLDGHIVQGHVDQTAACLAIKKFKGSSVFTFQYHPSKEQFVVSKGSVSVNGVSLTVVDAEKNCFSVAIIPYTFAHTNFSMLRKGGIVNVEFDVIGKYVAIAISQYSQFFPVRRRLS